MRRLIVAMLCLLNTGIASAQEPAARLRLESDPRRVLFVMPTSSSMERRKRRMRKASAPSRYRQVMSKLSW